MPHENMVIYSADHLNLHAPVTVSLLIVHLGQPGPTIDVGPHALTYDEIELIGEGQFRVLNNASEVYRYERSASSCRCKAQTHLGFSSAENGRAVAVMLALRTGPWSSETISKKIGDLSRRETEALLVRMTERGLIFAPDDALYRLRRDGTRWLVGRGLRVPPEACASELDP